MFPEWTGWEVSGCSLMLVPRSIFACFVGFGVSVPSVHCSHDLRVLKPESSCDQVQDFNGFLCTCLVGMMVLWEQKTTPSLRVRWGS